MDMAPHLYPENGPHLSESNFERLARFIYDHCGIRLTDKKRTMIDGRLRRRMRALGIGDINAYCRFLFDSGETAAQGELVHFIDAVTTNKTDFFREPIHFQYLNDVLLPQMINAGRRNLRFWSAASSTGAEAYTLAMVMEDFRLRCRDVDYSIIASDISTAVLAQAVLARYPISMIDPIPEDVRKRYVMVSRNPPKAEFRVKPALRTKVAFFQLNLMDDSYPVARDLDVVFCRNVLIYFDRPTQKKVLSRLCRHIRHGGYLILGHSESVTGLDLPLKSVTNTVLIRS